jgi:retinol dehydrogenase-12
MGFLSIVVWTSVIAFILYILKKFYNGPKTPYSKNMDGKIAIVTGSNTGIGKETALDLLSKGARVIFASRDENKTMAVINSITDDKMKENAIYMKLDLSNYESIRSFVQNFKNSFSSLDVLVNNAGGYFDAFNLKEGIEQTIMVNHIGPVYLTALLIPLINQNGLIVNLSSLMHTFINQKKFDEMCSITDYSNRASLYSSYQAYSFSKLGNVLHAVHLDNFALKNNLKFKTGSLHPGAVASDFQDRMTTPLYKVLGLILTPFKLIFFKDTKMGAQTTLHVIYTDYSKLNSGAYYSDCCEIPASEVAREPLNISKMMKFTKNLIYKNQNIPREVEKYLSEF